MRVLKQKDVKSFREKHNPKIDPITRQKIQNPVLDHDHDLGFCRGVLDRDTNQFLGKVESAYKRFLKHKGNINILDILENMRDYIDVSTNEAVGGVTNLEVYHPKAITKMVRKFERSGAKTQEATLKYMQVPAKEISECKTIKDRVKIFRKYFMKNC